MSGIYVPGTLTYVSETITNPYTGHQITIDGDYYVNFTSIIGDEDGDDFIYGSVFDQYWQLESSGGEILIMNITQYYSAPGDDIIILANEDNVLGDLTIQVSEGDDIVWANAGNDIIGGQAGDDYLHGGPGNDFIEGHGDNDFLIGASGDDVLYGGDGDDIIYGDSGETTVLDKDFIDSIAFPNLTERVNISDLAPPGDPSLGVNEGNLTLNFDSSAEITFRKGYAGYNNTLGVYRVAEDGTIEMASLLWENVKDAGVDQMHVIDLPLGDEGGVLGFFIISDGDRKNNYGDMDTGEAGNIRFVYDYNGANERDATIHDNGQDITILYDDGLTQSILKGDAYHTTARDGSTDINSDGANHVVTGLAEIGNEDVLRIGFEDLKNLGDADYEDVLFDINIVEKTTEMPDDGDDILYGGAGDDLLFGDGGDDILVLGEGYDEATGGSGADVFSFDYVDAMVDMIFDFDAFEGDVINLSDVLVGYDPLTDAITDFVLFTDHDGYTSVDVNVDGQGDDYMALFVVDGGLDMSVVDLFDAGGLVVDQSALV